MNIPDSRDILTLLGIGLIGFGLGLMHVPTALVVIGAILFIGGIRNNG